MSWKCTSVPIAFVAVSLMGCCCCWQVQGNRNPGPQVANEQKNDPPAKNDQQKDPQVNAEPMLVRREGEFAVVKPTDGGPPIALGGDTVLLEAFMDNQAAADLKYVGKLVQFSHECQPFFDYVPKKHGERQYNLTLNRVRVLFLASEAEKLASLKPHPAGGKRAVLTVQGMCRGLQGNVVTVSDAKLVSVREIKR